MSYRASYRAWLNHAGLKHAGFAAAAGLLLLAGLTQGFRVVSAQAPATLVSPTFTLAQQRAGEATYKQTCASCHGANLDDGQFAPSLRGPEFRAVWFGKPADALFEKIETMPPAAPGSLGAAQHAELLAYVMSQNQLVAGNLPVPTDIAQLRTMLLPGATGGPSGGLAGGVAIPSPPARPGPLDRYAPVTDALLQNPPASAWLTWRRGYDNLGFSPLQQINRQTVADLRAAWSWSLPNGPNEGTPLFHNGVLFVHAYGDRVQALDAVTGDLLWQYARRLPMGVNPSVKRSIGLYGDKVYTGTSDAHVVALDARTGRVIWDKEIAPAGFGLTGGVTVAKGKIIAGTTGRGPGGNFIVALDADTGAEAWRFNTIPREDEPGGLTWNGVPWDRRNGGSVWVPGAYDSATNLLYIGVAQTYDTGPYRNLVPGQNNDLLYTDSTLAINPDTGRLVWHFQHQPNDQWDYDWSFGRMVFPLNPNSPTLVGTGGKQAIFDFVDAATGRYAFSFDLGVQNVVTAIDPLTGAKRIDPQMVPGGDDSGTITACPHAGGAKNWLPESYNPTTKIMYIAIVEACMDMVPVAAGGRGSLSTGVRWTLRPRPDSDGLYGRVEAFNVETRRSVWKVRQRAPQSSGVLATAGGLVFAGAIDRNLIAYDDTTGRELWRFRLNDVPNAAPISYEVNGRQYIAVTVGNGGAQAATFPALTPEIRNPPDRGASLWVFELPNRAAAR